ncbi:reverse transcriptase (RNA-dependent DNA polymerase) domain-containing protein [Hirsutella rhossiliensis]|uniref:Reverse transcriptase (RNA-dependent DNA polymerase) domain-containing protein n=1 Tax=Hirsutella rhossiliensis TaxID=111463 RepID=A0A9P8MM36_9HYPO|nr:reverse transcriptase (RNA-dependent DNA polymerase) domain-containing protein [Hirsutella rhossiliensis]KAH0957655.1 reverse transcriptase (RNA-dependent DNA polymerase) domain-containing protein [Hirsutella rhossiliensis]
MVREVKGKDTKPYEKSRLVVQGHGDFEKTTLLTQSPTIQRVSQRLILAIAPGLLQGNGMTLSLRDITQAYPQSQTELFRTILTYLPTELQGKYPHGTIIRVIKPLYGIAEAGVHWYRTYQQHHLKNLDMSTSTYDSCLLITNTGPNTFGIVGMQTDDTLMLGTDSFSAREEEARGSTISSQTKDIDDPRNNG